MKHYFITGATGAIGSALVPELLADSTTQVTLLLRAKSDEELNTRVDELHRFWQIAPTDTANRSRVRALR
ncbi:MAG TPA: SDR family oxidoreductase, partial [Accumulibacter sp.]|nr:SDR family oxidoreductase [Accumulibacter sp.]